jgi:hypothetical protein
VRGDEVQRTEDGDTGESDDEREHHGGAPSFSPGPVPGSITPNRKRRATPGPRSRGAEPSAFTRGCCARRARGGDRAGRPIDEKRNGAAGLGRNGQA